MVGGKIQNPCKNIATSRLADHSPVNHVGTDVGARNSRYQ